MPPQVTTAPFFTNDAIGLFRVVVAFVIGMAPVWGTVVYFLRRGPDRRIDAVEKDITQLGRKVDDMAKQHEADRAVAVLLQREIAENQQELIGMLTASAAAHTDALHSVDRQVAILAQRADIADCFERFGQRIENAVISLAKTRT